MSAHRAGGDRGVRAQRELAAGNSFNSRFRGEHQDDVGGLRAGLETLELSRSLARLHTDLQLPLQPTELRPAAPDVAQLRELYGRYELRTLLRQLEGASVAEEKPLPSAGESQELV